MTTIESSSVERLQVVIDAACVDTASHLVEFAFTAVGVDPVNWFAGTWGLASPCQAVAYTPLLGVPPLDLAEGTWQVWVRITAGDEQPVSPSADLLVVV